MSLPARCADLCAALDEPVVATATRVDRWLLVEHRGAWGPTSVPDSRLAPAAATHLREAAATARARLLLLRRPHGTPWDQGRWVYTVDSRPGSEQVRRRHLASDEQLTALAPFTDPRGWQVVDGPLWLVCTHGRHDRCCAIRGRPVAQALAAAGHDTWECSHVGGDRFAANVLALPEGLGFGQVEPAQAAALAAGVGGGVLTPYALGRLRGRSSLSAPAQAAQHFARAATGRLVLADLHPVRQTDDGQDRWRVVLGGPAGDVRVVVRQVLDGEPHMLTCGGPQRLAAHFELVSID